MGAVSQNPGNPPGTELAIAGRNGRRSMISHSIINALNDVTWKVGLRKEKKKRHEVQITHAFLKFFDNVAKDYMEEECVEKLMGHDTGVKEHYDRHLPNPAIEQYLRAMPYFISEVYRN